ncbi:MAG: CcoQ/FixQ family Cbb3-type cytochrome c oxidase assembly chaperone [Bacteroidetes bacterium]|nr:CcoQ/FixQ family Cbb3-type cytochrome c oxidase assembly chaperone [Bacteroidota bacterium]
MKFINYLQSISEVGKYPLTSLVLFFLFFAALTIWVFKADKKYISNMKDMPFQGDDVV